MNPPLCTWHTPQHWACFLFMLHDPSFASFTYDALSYVFCYNLRLVSTRLVIGMFPDHSNMSMFFWAILSLCFLWFLLPVLLVTSWFGSLPVLLMLLFIIMDHSCLSLPACLMTSDPCLTPDFNDDLWITLNKQHADLYHLCPVGEPEELNNPGEHLSKATAPPGFRGASWGELLIGSW